LRGCFTLLIGLFAAVDLSAQTAPGVTGDFSGLADTRPSIAVIDDAGKETRGRLLSFDPDRLTLRVGGRDQTFDRQHVTGVYQLGDSLKNGARNGFIIGAALGVTAGAAGTDCGDFWVGVRSCTGGEKVRLAAVAGGVLGALGMGIGAGIDALITGRRVLYERPRGTETLAISIVPSLAHARKTLALTVAW
jgi:hypothetical protein